ncbi:MAG: hypothetical protein E2O37_03920 [Proteobacteria bacterium]|nr:MAG: hypothetical protein E2O37_03920 [Pseudomonadota bacterium]TDJ69692.1 MAG: hypothetical protein E2O38_12785 [Pseudomonadota bacterium]
MNGRVRAVRKFGKYLIAGSTVAIYTAVVAAHPEHTGDPPPVAVVSSAPPALAIDVHEPVGVGEQIMGGFWQLSG